LSVENCEKDNPSDNEGQGDKEDEEKEAIPEQPSPVEDKDQEYIIHLENKLAQSEIERQKAKEAADNNLNKLRYLMADFDNFRKRTEMQIESKLNQGKAALILKFVSIHDDLSRAIETARQGKSDQVVLEGLEGILRNVETLFDAEGVKEIETTGTPFDPNIHDAISFKYDDSVPENTVIAEIRKGYMISDKVLRPSLVEISKRIVKNTAFDSNRAKGD
jgi:molecular chaperone GrpE